MIVGYLTQKARDPAATMRVAQPIVVTVNSHMPKIADCSQVLAVGSDRPGGFELNVTRHRIPLRPRLANCSDLIFQPG